MNVKLLLPLPFARMCIVCLTASFVSIRLFVEPALASDFGTGLTDPKLSLNLAGISDWSTEMPFLNIMHMMRPWQGRPGSKGKMAFGELRDGGYLDENDWPKKIPEGISSIYGHWAWNPGDREAAVSRAGVYVLTYKGEGTIKFHLNAHILSSEPGRIVFENPIGGAMDIEITATDPNKTRDYVRDIAIVREEYEALAQAGELFNPDWLAVIEDARQLRFMDWMQTNGSSKKEWADMSQVGDVSWSAGGVPVEVMVQLANQIGADPWFCMPHMATDDYIRQFAAYVRDHLDPRLVAYVEYSNETWNWSFPQTRWLKEQADVQWSEGGPREYLAKRATETALIWDEVFREEADDRVQNVLGIQNGAAGPLRKSILSGGVWAKHEPDSFALPASVFDAVAVTTYIGGMTAGDADMLAKLLEVIRNPNADANAWLAAKLMDPDYGLSIPQIQKSWSAVKAVTDKYGLELITYEGGQHVHHNGKALRQLSGEENALAQEFLINFVRSPEMAHLYSELWEAWSLIGDGPFMHYSDVRAPNKYGSWGLLSALGDTNPRAEYLFEQNKTAASWFGDGGGTRYQQGVITIAGNNGETLAGTDKADFLIGGDGNDTFIAGKGNDAFNGGEGNDTIELEGTDADYTFRHDGFGYRVDGATGSIFIVNIETAKFSDGTTKPTSELASN